MLRNLYRDETDKKIMSRRTSNVYSILY